MSYDVTLSVGRTDVTTYWQFANRKEGRFIYWEESDTPPSHNASKTNFLQQETPKGRVDLTLQAENLSGM